MFTDNDSAYTRLSELKDIITKLGIYDFGPILIVDACCTFSITFTTGGDESAEFWSV